MKQQTLDRISRNLSLLGTSQSVITRVVWHHRRIRCEQSLHELLDVELTEDFRDVGQRCLQEGLHALEIEPLEDEGAIPGNERVLGNQGVVGDQLLAGAQVFDDAHRVTRLVVIGKVEDRCRFFHHRDEPRFRDGA